MPIKQLKKILWIFGGVMGLFLVITAFIIFTSKEVKGIELPQMPKPIDRNPETPPNIYYYTIVWEAKANTNPPPTPPKPVAVAAVKKNYLEQAIRRSLKIVNIMSDSYAIVRFRGRDNLLEVYDPKSSQKQSKGILNGLGSRAYVVKIVPEKGIKFRNDNGEQAWLHLPHIVESYKGLVKKMAIKLRGTRKGNKWQIVPEESARLAKNYNQYLKQMRLKPHSMRGKTIGLRIQKVSSKNEAYYYGLRQDDVVTNINNTSLQNISEKDIKKLIKRYRKNKNLRIKLLRGGQPVVLNYNFGN